jgi:hypothetical protein
MAKDGNSLAVLLSALGYPGCHQWPSCRKTSRDLFAGQTRYNSGRLYRHRIDGRHHGLIIGLITE